MRPALKIIISKLKDVFIISVLKEHFSSSLVLRKRPELLPVSETDIINR